MAKKKPLLREEQGGIEQQSIYMTAFNTAYGMQGKRIARRRAVIIQTTVTHPLSRIDKL